MTIDNPPEAPFRIDRRSGLPLHAQIDALLRDLIQHPKYAGGALIPDEVSLARQLDWVAKYRMVEGYRQRHSLEWDDPKLAAMDLQYHDVRPER